MWMVMAVKKSIEVELPAFRLKQELPLSCAGGMVGMIPVFDTREDAEEYADGKFDVVQVEVKPRGNDA